MSIFDLEELEKWSIDDLKNRKAETERMVKFSKEHKDIIGETQFKRIVEQLDKAIKIKELEGK